jgi:hypothetical protein
MIYTFSVQLGCSPRSIAVYRALVVVAAGICCRRVPNSSTCQREADDSGEHPGVSAAGADAAAERAR